MYYWKSGKCEVDFVYIGADNVPVPIEVKYRSRINHKELGGMAAFLDASGAKRGIVATRGRRESRHDYELVPLPMLLLLL